MTNTDQTPPTRGGQDASKPADEIRNAARDVGHAASEAASEVKAKLGEEGDRKVDDATSTAGASLRQVADQLRQAGDNLDGEQGWAKQAFTQGAQGLERVSGYLSEGRLDDFTKDLQSFSRSNPAAFLAGSVALGFLVARVAKTATEHANQPAPAASSPAASQPEPQVPAQDRWEEQRSFAPAQDDEESRRLGRTL